MIGRNQRKSTYKMKKKRDETIIGPVRQSIDFDRTKLKEVSKILEQGSPMQITNVLVDYPCSILMCGLVLFIALGSIALSLNYFLYDYSHQRDYLIWSDPKVETWDML